MNILWLDFCRAYPSFVQGSYESESDERKAGSVHILMNHNSYNAHEGVFMESKYSEVIKLLYMVIAYRVTALVFTYK